MNVYSSLVIVGLLLFSGCNRSGEDNVSELSTKSIVPRGGEVLFDVISKSNTLEDLSGKFRESGHYSMVFQAKSKSEDFPIGGLVEREFYKMFENDRSVNESKLRISQDLKTVSNKILLLLDFSGSIVDDCSDINATKDPQNLCYQIVNSSKQFIDQIISKNQTMAIYYFNSKNKIQPLWRSPDSSDTTSDAASLKSSLDNLYSASWRAKYLEGFNSTNLYGAVIDSTAVVCRWFDDCIVGKESKIGGGNQKNYDFATIVIFTDGHHNVNNNSTQEMLSTLALYKRNYYYTIGLGNDVDDTVLKQIGKSGYLKAEQTDTLDAEFNKLGEQLSSFSNSFYKIDYCPAQQNGLLDLRLDVKDSRGFYGTISQRVDLLELENFRCDL